MKPPDVIVGTDYIKRNSSFDNLLNLMEYAARNGDMELFLMAKKRLIELGSKINTSCK